MTTNDNKREEPAHDIAQQLALYADMLRDCSARGLKYASNTYDQHNYEKVQQVAMELLALATAQPILELEPLRAPIFSRPSPLTVADAAIIDEAGRILLIRRSDNKKWAMPGGGLDVGETPAEGAVREALEETGVSCEAIKLVGVHDSRLTGSTARHHLYQFVFLCRPLLNIPRVETPSHAFEVLETAWFAENALPADLSPGHVRRIPHAFRVWHGDDRAYFDQ